jgi:hypothetical protein
MDEKMAFQPGNYHNAKANVTLHIGFADDGTGGLADTTIKNSDGSLHKVTFGQFGYVDNSNPVNGYAVVTAINPHDFQSITFYCADMYGSTELRGYGARVSASGVQDLTGIYTRV